MIKLDIVNAVVAKTLISRTKAEQAVETIFESLKQALGRGQRIELRRFGVFSVKPRKTGIGRNPAHRRRSQHPSRQSRPLQTRQRTPRHRSRKKILASVNGSPATGSVYKHSWKNLSKKIRRGI